ncbi:hypothetical protein JHK85_001048 [Glycine max]|nr:hypothetical protein JHK85_001048 [Glycine max]
MAFGIKGDDEPHPSAQVTLVEWKSSQNVNSTRIQEVMQQPLSDWIKPPEGFMNCNIDATFFMEHGLAGFGAFIRENLGQFVLARIGCMEVVMSVREGEAFAILQSLLWNIDLQLFSVIIETDCKFIADQEDILECGGNSQSH